MALSRVSYSYREKITVTAACGRGIGCDDRVERCRVVVFGADGRR